MALKKLKWLKYLFIDRTEAKTEQNYWNEKRKKHMANEHSPGIVKGLEVTADEPPSLSVVVAAGRAIDGYGNDPEIESVQTLDCSSLVPPGGAMTVYIVLHYSAITVEPYFVNEIGDYQDKYIQDSYILEVTTDPPVEADRIELARIELLAGVTEITEPDDPAGPDANEIDSRYREYAGKEALALKDLSDVNQAEADAFNNMNSPGASNPIATIADVAAGVGPVETEVQAARGTRPSLDERLDVMLEEDGTFKGITQITPSAPLVGGGSVGNIPIGIVDATPSARGAMSAEDKEKLDEIEPGATADQTAQEILDLVKTVDGDGSGLDADLLDGHEAEDFFGLIPVKLAHFYDDFVSGRGIPRPDLPNEQVLCISALHWTADSPMSGSPPSLLFNNWIPTLYDGQCGVLGVSPPSGGQIYGVSLALETSQPGPIKIKNGLRYRTLLKVSGLTDHYLTAMFGLIYSYPVGSDPSDGVYFRLVEVEGEQEQWQGVVRASDVEMTVNLAASSDDYILFEFEVYDDGGTQKVRFRLNQGEWLPAGGISTNIPSVGLIPAYTLKSESGFSLNKSFLIDFFDLQIPFMTRWQDVP